MSLRSWLVGLTPSCADNVRMDLICDVVRTLISEQGPRHIWILLHELAIACQITAEQWVGARGA